MPSELSMLAADLGAPKPPTRATVRSLRFEPDEKLEACILSDITSANCTLGDIAERAQTSPQALCLWLARPDIAQKLDDIESVFGRRCRLQLADNTGAIMRACNQVIDDYISTNSRWLFRENNFRGHAMLAKKGANALTASRVLLYLAKHFSPRSPRLRPTAIELQPQQDHPNPARAPVPASDLPPASASPSATRFTLLTSLPDIADIITAPCAAGSPRSGGSAATRLEPASTTIQATPSDREVLSASSASDISNLKSELPLPPPAHDSSVSPASHASHISTTFHASAGSSASYLPDSVHALSPLPQPPAAAFQAEGPTVPRRGWSESASDTPGPSTPNSPHPDGVHAAPANKPRCACPSASTCKSACSSASSRAPRDPARLNE